MANHIDDDRVPIIDIRRGEHGDSMPREISEKLRFRDETERTLPTMILYNGDGLRLFEDITYLDEYYLTNAEIEVLNKHAQEIADMICSNSRIVELGSGYASPDH